MTNQNIQCCIPKNTKVVSFDIFDTLFFRKTDPPEEVIRLISNKICQKNLISLSEKDIYTLRCEIEKKLRIKNKTLGFDSECSINDIYTLMVQKTCSKVSVKELLDIELNIETNLLFAMPSMNKVINNLSKQFKLILISDTYYPLWMIEHYLTVLGLSSFFSNIYCSCDYKLNKGSGRLFKQVLASENVSSKELVHFGDNIQCDFLIPKKLGITSYMLLNSWNLKRRLNLRLLNRYEIKDEMWKAGSFFNKLLLKNPFENSMGDLFSWGEQVMGPLIVIFVHLLIQHLNDKKFTHLYFLARDGFILKKIFNILSKELYHGKRINPTYLCVSRFSTYAASIKKLGQREFLHAISGSNIKVKDILNRLQVIPTPEVCFLLKRHDLSLNQLIHNPDTKGNVRSLFNDKQFEKIVLDNSKNKRSNLKKYLDHYSFFGKKNKVALIDIGWLGTIQDNIYAAFSDQPDFPSIKGYYLASTRHLNNDIQKNGKNKIGILYDYKHCVPEQVSISFFREALEFSTRALHGTTIGYRCDKCKLVKPIFKQNTNDQQIERQLNKDILQIQKGVYSFLTDYIKLQKVYSIPPKRFQKYITTRYDKLISFPEKRFINAIRRIGNADDFGVDEIRSAVIPFTLKDILSPKKTYHRFIDTPWREASLVSVKFPFLNLFYLSVKRLVIWKRIDKQAKL